MEYQFDFDQLDSFIPGAEGEPGQRTFYMQARIGDRVVALRCEKEQVAMLGRYLAQLVVALGSPEPERDVTGLIEPVQPQFIVGTITVGVDEANNVIQVTLEELIPENIEVIFGEQSEDDIEDMLDENPEGARARFTLRSGQAAAFAETAEELMAAGRPPCRLCGRPIGPEGHSCPRWN